MPNTERIIRLKTVLDRTGLSLICPLLSGPKSLLFWIMKETLNAIEEAHAGGDYRQAA